MHEGAAEAGADESSEGVAFLERKQRLSPALDHEHSRVDRGDGAERRPWDPPAEPEAVPRAPRSAEEVVRPAGALARDLPLHDEIRALQLRAWVVEQSTEQRGRDVERNVRDHTEGLGGKWDVPRVAFDHSDGVVRREPLPEPVCPHGIELDGDHGSRAPRKLGREDTPAGSDLQDEIGPLNP